MSPLQPLRFAVLLTLLWLMSSARGQEPVVPPAPESFHRNQYETPGEVPHVESNQPAIGIGGPFGVIIGGGRGVRIGGPNGVQFGGGVGARFGGRNGVQFGGGEGVRIGPREYAMEPTNGLNDSVPNLAQFRDGNETHTRIHHPLTATHAVRLRINGQDTVISPGETLLLIGQEHPVSVQLIRPNGRYGLRRALSPGDYVFSQTRRGWTLVLGEVPSESSPAPNVPFPAELSPPSIEQLPTPNAQPSLDTPDVSVLHRSTSSP